MKKLIIALIVTVAVTAGAITFLVPYNQPAKANAEAVIDPSQIMMKAKDLPLVQHDDYSVVFN